MLRIGISQLTSSKWRRDGRIELQPLARSICFQDSAGPSPDNPPMFGTPGEIRTLSTSPFERDGFANLPTGVWCDWPDSNRHGKTRGILSPLRLPVTPQSRICLVPRERFELSKAGLLRTVAVPVCMSHRGIELGARSRNRT